MARLTAVGIYVNKRNFMSKEALYKAISDFHEKTVRKTVNESREKTFLRKNARQMTEAEKLRELLPSWTEEQVAFHYESHDTSPEVQAFNMKYDMLELYQQIRDNGLYRLDPNNFKPKIFVELDYLKGFLAVGTLAQRAVMSDLQASKNRRPPKRSKAEDSGKDGMGLNLHCVKN